MILRHAFIPPDNQRLQHLCGPLDEHLRSIEAALGVSIARRNESFRVEGERRAAERAVALLQSLYDRAKRPIGAQALQLAIADAAQPGERAGGGGDDDDEIVLRTRRADLSGRTPNQRRYLRHMLDHDITFGIGPAGTGKTFLAVACAVDALERSQVQRIVLTRPAVEAGERLGFLPGDLAQKVDPYLRPLYDALYDLMGFDRVTRAFEKGTLEIAPLAFMRGRTLNHAFVILDEAQNTTREQMKMFLTRIGFGSKAVVNGDVSQIDLPKGTGSGLVDAERILRKVQGIAITRFTAADVVRHPLVARIVEAYDAAAKRPAAARDGAIPAAMTQPELRLSLQFADARHRPLLPRHRVARWLRAALERPAELTVRIVDHDEGRVLNRDYRGRDYATNVLTFDYQREPQVVADLVLCAPVVEAEARDARRPVEAHYAHLLVHGALHAQGYDHERAADARRMETRESALLQSLGFGDPYAR